MGDQQGRKWLLTINNPEEHGLGEETVAEAMSKLSVAYWCSCREEGSTPHQHVFLYDPVPLAFGRLKRLFPPAHITRCTGTCRENRDYLLKVGKWEGTEKADTSVPGTFSEHGDLPSEREGRIDDHELLLDLVGGGKTTIEIIKEYPQFIYRAKVIDDLRQRMLEERYGAKDVDLDVTYVFGPTGVGKSRDIMAAHRQDGVCRITSYRNGSALFDSYNAEPVLVFEEFDSQVPLCEMLNYLDRYRPLRLPARYYERVACYDKVYLTSNIPLEEQYPSEQICHPDRWKALVRRINRVVEYGKGGTRKVTEMKRGKNDGCK
jgi:hypothetical protein